MAKTKPTKGNKGKLPAQKFNTGKGGKKPKSLGARKSGKNPAPKAVHYPGGLPGVG